MRIIFKAVTPFLKFITPIKFRFKKYKVTYRKAQDLKHALNVGDIILSSAKGELTNLVNPSKGFTHLTQVISPTHVVEATAEGTDIVSLDWFFASKDHGVVLRSNIYGSLDKDKLYEEADRIRGRKYDYLFSPRADKFYCFEVGAHLLEKCLGIRVIPSRLFNYEFYDADSFLESKDLFIVAKF